MYLTKYVGALMWACYARTSETTCKLSSEQNCCMFLKCVSAPGSKTNRELTYITLNYGSSQGYSMSPSNA